MSQNAPIDFGKIRKNASSTRIVTLDFFNVIANFWQAGKEYATNDYCRPSASTGFSYLASSGGQSGGVEPIWPTTVDATVTDGAVTWTAKTAGGNGIDRLSWGSPEPAASITPTGLTVSAQAIVDGQGTESAIRLTLAGGTAGTQYTVSISATSGSQTLVGVFSVLVL